VVGDWGEHGWLIALGEEGASLERFTPEATTVVDRWPGDREGAA
jgi:hypothetical protein